jgi:hypothetical protein
MATKLDDEERSRIKKAFRERVNMGPKALESWLDKAASRKVGQKKGGGESTGHASGRRIVNIKRKKAADLDDSDLRDMRKVVGYIERHLAQRPKGDVGETTWRKSLMNWGHDPLKSKR